MNGGRFGRFFLEFVRNNLYTDNIRNFLEFIGIDQKLSDIYWNLFYTIKTCRVGDTSSKFYVETRKEYIRLEDFMGEKPVIEDLLKTARKEDIFFDVGANIGTYTCLIANNLSPYNVVSFEPHPKNVKRLEQNIQLNKQKVHVYRYALSDKEEEKTLEVRDNDFGEGRHRIATEEGNNGINIETVTGDELIKRENLSLPNIIKIDVEGAELKVIKGLRKTLKNNDVRILYCEIHPNKLKKYQGTEKEIYDILEGSGFQINKLLERGEEYFLKATK